MRRLNSAASNALRSNQHVVQDGTVIRPGWRFNRERGTGAYRNGAGRLAFAVNSQRALEITQNDAFMRAAGAADVSPFAMARITPASANGQQMSIDAYDSTTLVGRLSSYRQSATQFGWKLYSYDAGVAGLNVAPGLTLNASNDLAVGRNLSAVAGIFSGAVSGTTGTFSSNGSFSGSLSSASFTTGSLSATTIFASGQISNAAGGFSIVGSSFLSGQFSLTGAFVQNSGGSSFVGGMGIRQQSDALAGGLRIVNSPGGIALDLYIEGGTGDAVLVRGANSWRMIAGAWAPSTNVGQDFGTTAARIRYGYIDRLSIQTGNTPNHAIDMGVDDAFKPGTSTWGVISDVRTKTKSSMTPYTRGLDEIMQLRPIHFRYNGRYGSPRDGTIHAGLVAQEVQGVIPSMIRTSTYRKKDEDAGEEMLAINYHELFLTLVTAVQQMERQIQALEGRNG